MKGEGRMKALAATVLRPVQVAGVIWAGCGSTRPRTGQGGRTMKVSVGPLHPPHRAAAGGREEGGRQIRRSDRRKGWRKGREG